MNYPCNPINNYNDIFHTLSLHNHFLYMSPEPFRFLSCPRSRSLKNCDNLSNSNSLHLFEYVSLVPESVPRFVLRAAMLFLLVLKNDYETELETVSFWSYVALDRLFLEVRPNLFTLFD